MLESKTSIRQIILTPELAKEYLHKICPNNRKVSERAVVNFSNEIKLNRWKLNNDAICFDTNGLMINGQHRCHAVVRAKKNIPAFVITDMPGESFIVMDTGKKRTGKDVLEIVGCKNARTVAGALRYLYLYINNNLSFTQITAGMKRGGSCITNQDVLDTYNKYPDIIKFINDAKLSRVILSPAIGLFCNYVFYKADETLAEIFMEGFYKGANLGNDNIVLVLRNRLLKERASYTHIRPSLKIALVFKAWNYFVHNKKVGNLTMPTEMPIVAGDKLLNGKPTSRLKEVKEYAKERSIEMDFRK